MKKQLVALVAVGLVAAGAAQAGGNPIQGDPVVARIDAPLFLGPTPQCPQFRVHTRLLSESGGVIGSSLLCVSQPPEEPEGMRIETGVLTLHVPGGKIVTDATLVYSFAGFPNVTQTISGTVVGGSGHYCGATGTLSGGGTIVFDENFVPHPDVTIVADLD